MAMRDPSIPLSEDPDLSQAGAASQERLLVALSYGLFLIGFAGGLPLFAGAIIALVRKPHARGTLYESHYRNLLLVFFVTLAFAGVMLAWAMLGAVNVMGALFGSPFAWIWSASVFGLLMPAAMLVSLFLGLWYFWRVLRGFIRALDEKPY
jgi:uncharacterized membrane protein